MYQARDAVLRLEAIGYRALWIPEAVGREPFASASSLLATSTSMTIATGIANVHARSPITMNAGWQTITDAFPGRFILGMGVSHQDAVERRHGGVYERPLATMAAYLDAMDKATFAAARPTSEPVRVLAALGPRMLELAAERASGALTYLVPVEHTSVARSQLGPGKLLSVEHAAVVEPDAAAARAIGRRFLAPYLAMRNYTANLLRLGWSDRDLDGPSDRLVDALVAWGRPEDVVSQLRRHLDAGADQVAVQVLPHEPRALPMTEWAAIAQAWGESPSGVSTA